MRLSSAAIAFGILLALAGVLSTMFFAPGVFTGLVVGGAAVMLFLGMYEIVEEVRRDSARDKVAVLASLHPDDPDQ